MLKNFFKSIALIAIALTTINNSLAFQVTNKNINDLKIGKTNPAVKELQIFLNENGFYDVETGAGSPGNETEYFGKVTENSIKLFQQYMEIPINGKIDFQTGKTINEYSKQLKAQEDEYAEYSADGSGAKGKTIDIGEIYNLDKVLDTTYNTNVGDVYKEDLGDTYDTDVVDSYSDYGKKPEQDSEPKSAATSIRDLLEKLSGNSRSGNNNFSSPTEQPKNQTFFTRFFSIFK